MYTNPNLIGYFVSRREAQSRIETQRIDLITMPRRLIFSPRLCVK